MPDLTVAENLFFGREPSKPGVREPSCVVQGRRILARRSRRGGHRSPSTRSRASASSTGRSSRSPEVLSRDPKVLVLDEATSALTTDLQGIGCWIMCAVAPPRSASVVLIPTRLAEMLAVADRVTVFRGGCERRRSATWTRPQAMNSSSSWSAASWRASSRPGGTKYRTRCCCALMSSRCRVAFRGCRSNSALARWSASAASQGRDREACSARFMGSSPRLAPSPCRESAFGYDRRGLLLAAGIRTGAGRSGKAGAAASQVDRAERDPWRVST